MKLKKYLYKSVTSTNDVAIKKIRQGFLSGIIISKKQTKGRGRYGNKWISIKKNLFMSVFFNLNRNKSLKNLTFITCRIVQKSLFKLIKKKIKIKKPNDLLINEKKLCGILQETIFYKSKKFAIVGIGINVDRSPIIVNYPTTYVNLCTKKKLANAKSYNEIKKNFEKYIKY